MLRRLMFPGALALSAMIVLSAQLTVSAADEDKPVVVLETSLGPITIELDKAKAPISVDNFLKYVDKKFYDGVVFHRVISRTSPYMIQTGGMTETNNVLHEKRAEALSPIKNESGNGLSNVRGTIAMARTRNPDSATSQFYINFDDNSRLDTAGGGYAVFGKIIGGIDVVDTISKVETKRKSDDTGHDHDDVPATPVLIKSATRKPKS